MPKYFIWLIDSCEPRKGPPLIKGEKHLIGDYSASVVETWVKTKAAKYADDTNKKSTKEG